MYDFLIIGAGVVGSAIARELSRYSADICLLEKSDDVSNGASKANSGIIHGGYAALHGSLKGKLNASGNGMFQKLDDELNFGYRKTGALVLAFDGKDLKRLEALMKNGRLNGLENLRIIGTDEILNLEPNINPSAKYALLCDDVGVVSPYEYNIALAENAIQNGTQLFLDTEVTAINRENRGFSVETTSEVYRSKYVINAAGIYSDRISAMAVSDYFKLTPKKGQYILFQKDTGNIVSRVIFQTPTEKGKGILVTSTYHGNLMLGPNSEEAENREDTGTDEETLEYIIETAKKSVPDFDTAKILKTFSGIRPSPSTKDFIVKEESPGFINAAGIESPGLTSSPAIAQMVVNIINRNGSLSPKKDFNPFRKGIIIKKDLSPSEISKRVRLKSILCMP